MKCFYCAEEHDAQKCPLVKACEYWPDGVLKRIEFVTFADMGGSFQLVKLD